MLWDRNQLQEKNVSKYTNMVAKKSATKQPMDQPKNQRKKQKILWNKWKQKHKASKSIGHSKISSKRELHSNISSLQQTRKIPNIQPNITPKVARKRINKTGS